MRIMFLLVYMKIQMKERKCLREMPLDEVLKAMETAGKWITKKFGNPATGPLSEAMLGDKAAVVLPKLAYCKLAGGDWVWKDGLSLTTQLIRIIRTEISHRLRDCTIRKEPSVLESLSDDYVAREADRSMMDELMMEDETRDLGYKLIFEWLKDYPELTNYVRLVRELNSYRAISKRLRVKIGEVKELEMRTMKVIEEKRRGFG